MLLIACLTKEHLAQKRVTEDRLVVINFEQACLKVSFTKR